ncbi:MAG: F0F1 ATP synthase subunit B [Gammaproteobacteria bacterium]|nr:F0F1 ATP synthase subunit B [Gammaproteobacteria bacterium]NIR83292.1 F0F1 ATP synthase subunit B [Gammaproteobacteria bacterium]NIR91092.1 F0F1 ATP synthase subunit B [Gammaproteobacteria bacterium]NIU04459.1 F0F1 ATP synthase subunit B [Gammaproteobacteria bacterium]NIW87095.1 F0F1 ATP synthase subunit B [Gammaproteobacteria bacterium]
MNITLTLFAQMVTFAILVWFVMHFLWEPVINMLENRRRRIADGLAAAERGQHERELAEKHARETLNEAREQAKQVIAQAQKRADEIVEEAKDDARAEGQRLIEAARGEITQEMNQAREALRGEVVRLAMAGAEQVLMREVDAAAHNEVLEKLATRL